MIDNQNLINLPNTTSDRPNMVAGQSCLASNPNINDWINYNAFQQQAIGNPGNEGRAQWYGPHQRSVDFSLFKDFIVHERYRLSFRTEVYNLSNTENYGLPNSGISGWTKSRDPSGIPTNASAFGQITASNLTFYPRVLQFALKLSF